MSSLLIQKLDNLGSDKLPNPEVCMKNLEKFMQNVPCGTIPCLGPKFYKPPIPFVSMGGEGTSSWLPLLQMGDWVSPPLLIKPKTQLTWQI